MLVSRPEMVYPASQVQWVVPWVMVQREGRTWEPAVAAGRVDAAAASDMFVVATKTEKRRRKRERRSRIYSRSTEITQRPGPPPTPTPRPTIEEGPPAEVISEALRPASERPIVRHGSLRWVMARVLLTCWQRGLTGGSRPAFTTHTGELVYFIHTRPTIKARGGSTLIDI